MDPDIAEQLRTALANGGIFLTPNKRLSSYIRDKLLAHAAGDIWLKTALSSKNAIESQSLSVAWSAPKIAPYQSWVEDLWKRACLAGLVEPEKLLAPVEELVIWQGIVENHAMKNLLAPSLAAHEARKAYHLLAEWLVDIDEYRFQFSCSPDSQIFYSWYQSFREEITARRFTTLSDIQAQLLDVPAANLLELLAGTTENIGNQLVLLGFQSPSPLQKKLIEYIARGVRTSGPAEVGRYTSLQLSTKCKQVDIAAFEDFSQEITAAGKWARDILQRNPLANIAIVVPNLEQKKLLVERKLLEALEPDALALYGDNSGSAYNLSAGTAVLAVPMVDVFVNFIESVLQPVDRQYWSTLLYSPYIFTAFDGLDARNILIQAMYESGEAAFAFSDLLRLIEWQAKRGRLAIEAGSIPDYDQLLKAFSTSSVLLSPSKKRRVQLPSEWLESFRQFMQLLGWPGNRSQDSNEYQQLQAFQKVCDHFWRFDDVVGKVTALRALQLFKQQLQMSVFHRQTVERPDYATPQVLGVLEASGQLFDYLWITGLSDRAWPPRPSPNSLLPYALQAELDMPSSSEEREFAYAIELMRGFCSSTTHLHLSYPVSEDQVACCLSPVVEQCVDELLDDSGNAPPVTRHDSVAAVDMAADIKPSLAAEQIQVFEYLDDSQGQPYPNIIDSTGKKIIKGGMGILQDYAINPLKAYARYRLHCEPLPEIVKGFSPLERGILVHGILESCWRRLGSSEVLKSQSQAELEAVVQQSIEAIFPTVVVRRFKSVSASLLALEKQSLQKLLIEWLRYESERAAFSVEHLEYVIEFEVDGYWLTGRIDRVDRLATGQLLLLDYKTGRIGINGWLDERLTAPQLPFYTTVLAAAEHRGDIPALAFASLKAGELSFKGLAEADTAATEVVGIEALSGRQLENYNSLATLAEHWSEALGKLVSEVSQGYAAFEALYFPLRDDDPYRPFIRSGSVPGTDADEVSA